MLHTHIAFLRNFRIGAFAAASFLLAFVGLAIFPVASSFSDTEATAVISETSLTLSTENIELDFNIDNPNGTFLSLSLPK